MSFTTLEEFKQSAQQILGKYCDDYTIIKPYAHSEVLELLAKLQAASSVEHILQDIYALYNRCQPSYINHKLLRKLGQLLSIAYGQSSDAVNDYLEISCCQVSASYAPTQHIKRGHVRTQKTDPIKQLMMGTNRARYTEPA